MEICWKPCLTSPAKVALVGYIPSEFPAYDSTSCNTDWLLIFSADRELHSCEALGSLFFADRKFLLGLQEEHDLAPSG